MCCFGWDCGCFNEEYFIIIKSIYYNLLYRVFFKGVDFIFVNGCLLFFRID